MRIKKPTTLANNSGYALPSTSTEYYARQIESEVVILDETETIPDTYESSIQMSSVKRCLHGFV